jgi:hypothetical protein
MRVDFDLAKRLLYSWPRQAAGHADQHIVSRDEYAVTTSLVSTVKQ